MHRNKLLNLFARNAKKGQFRAEATAEESTIYLYDVIVSSKADAEWWGGVDAETFVQTLRGMSGDVAIRINSPGGDVFAARAMAQAIRDYPGNVTAYVDGYAASAASFITSVSNKVVVSQGGMIMIHKAWSIAMGNADDFRATAALLEKIDGTIVETYAAAAQRRGIAPADFAALMAAETWLTGAEAIELGLADELASDPAPSAAVQWDLSAYDNAPAVAAIAPTPRADVTADMSARQAQLYEAVEGIAESLGQFDQTSGANGAHYMAANPFAGEGIKCANCAFYDGARACEAVSGEIDPEAVCKLWIIPEALIAQQDDPNASATSAFTNEIERRRRSAALMLHEPA